MKNANKDVPLVLVCNYCWIVAEFLAAGVTWVKTFRQIRHLRRLGSKGGVSITLLQDGTHDRLTTDSKTEVFDTIGSIYFVCGRVCFDTLSFA